MNSFYSSDEDVAWGQVTPREIKRHMKGQIGKKPHKRHSISNLSRNPKETVISLETSILNDITNKSNSSGTAMEYLIINDTFEEETTKKSNIDSPTVHVHPAVMLDNLPATTVNNTVLSEDAGYDVSVPLSENDICTPRKDEDSLIIISDDDFEELNRQENNFDFQQGSSDLLAKLKYERISNYQGDTSDYHESVSIKSDDASKEQLNVSNCLSLLSVVEDTEEKCMSIGDYHDTLQYHDPERDSEHSILLEKEFSPQIRDSCGYILENKVDSLACQDCQSGDEIELMSQLDYESAGNGICDPESDNSHEQHYDSENIQNSLNVSRHSLSELDKEVATDEETKVKCMSTDRYFHDVTLQDNNPEKYGEHSIILEKEVSQQIQDPSENKEDSMVHLDCPSVNEIELMLNGEPVGNEACHIKSDNSCEQYDIPENIQKGLNVSRHSSSKLNKDVVTDEDTKEKCVSTDKYYHHVTLQDQNPEKYGEHSIILEKEVSQQIQDPSENKEDSMVYLDCPSVNEIELMLNGEPVGNEACRPKSDNSYEQSDVPETTQKSFNISRHNLSKLNKDVVTEEDIGERCMSIDGDYSYVTLQDNDPERNSEHSMISGREVSQHIQYSYGYISGNKKESLAHLALPERNNSYKKYDVPENTQKDMNVSGHNLSKLSIDMNISLYDGIQSNSTPQKKGDVHVENECEQDYFQNHKSVGSDGSNMNICNDSSNNEELNNTLDMVERMLNEHMEIHGKSVDKQNNTNSTLPSSASKEKSRIPKLLKSPQIGDTFKVPQTSQKPKLHTPKSASKLNFKDVVSPVGLYIKYSPKPVLKQNVNAVEFKSPALMKKIATSPQVSKPIRSNCQDFPAAIYKPSKKQVTSSAKKLFLPPSLEKMVQEPTLVKHEGLRNHHHNESDIDRLLLSESELTRCSISDSVLESSSQDISLLTMKPTLK